MNAFFFIPLVLKSLIHFQRSCAVSPFVAKKVEGRREGRSQYWEVTSMIKPIIEILTFFKLLCCLPLAHKTGDGDVHVMHLRLPL